MQTKGSIGNLIRRYKAVLNKCRIMNTFGSLLAAAVLALGGTGAAMGASYYADAPPVFDTTIDQPKQHGYGDIDQGKNVLVSGKNTTSGADTSTAVTGYAHGTAYNNGNIWVKDGYAEAMGGVFGESHVIVNQGNIYVDGTNAWQTKGMGVNSGGKAVNRENGVIAVLKGSGMTDNSGSTDKTIINNGIISVEDAGGVGIFYRKEAVDGEVTNNGSIFVSNGGTGVLLANDADNAAYNNKHFTNTGTITAEKGSTAILVASSTSNATVELTDESRVDGLISLQGRNNRLVVADVGEAGTETLHVQGAFSGSITGSNIAFSDDSRPALDNAFTIDKDSYVSMSGVTLVRGERNNARPALLLDNGDLTLNGGLDGSAGSLASLRAEKGGLFLNAANISGSPDNVGAPLPAVDGGALSVKGQSLVHVENSSFKSNAGASGGALYNEGRMTLKNSSFAGNSASAEGGALYNAEGGTVTFSAVNVFTGNSAAGKSNDIYNKGIVTVADGATHLHGGYRQEGASSGLVVRSGATLSIAMPDMGGVEGKEGAALLALGAPLDLGAGTLTVGNVQARNHAAAAFGPDSVLVVDGRAAAQSAMIRAGESGSSMVVSEGATLYIANAQAGESYTITEGLDAAEGDYWSSARLLGNRLTEVSLSLDGGKIMVATEAKEAAKTLPGVIPVRTMNAMMEGNLNDTDSLSAGIRFLSRALEAPFMLSDKQAVAVVNEVSRAAVTAGVQNTALRLAEASADQLMQRLSLSFAGRQAHRAEGLDIWASPLYGNTYSRGMVSSGASVRGNYGGLALGADVPAGEILGGKVRAGVSVHGGGGRSESGGTAVSTNNSYNFGGFGLYAGWNTGNLNIVGSVGLSAADHDVNMSLPASMGLGRAKAAVDTDAFIADIRAEYRISTPALDILPHAGVRSLTLRTKSHDVTSGGEVLNRASSDTQHIIEFPVGVSLSKELDVAGWNVKPLVDLSVIPAVGERDYKAEVSYTGINAADTMGGRIMDAASFSGTAGLQAEKGSFALGLHYGVQASRHETDQRIHMGISWKF